MSDLQNRQEEIDLIEVGKVLFLKKRTIIKITSIFFVLSVIYSLVATPYYESTITLYPAGELAEASSMLGDLQGIAESFGISGLSGTPIYNIPDIINSRRLKKEIVLQNWESDLFASKVNLIQYWELDKPPLIDLGKIKSFILPKKISINPHYSQTVDAVEVLSELITVNEENSGLISVSVLMEEPQLASEIANFIAEYVVKFVKEEQQKQAGKNREFVESRLSVSKIDLNNSEENLTNFRKKHPLALDSPELQQDRGRLIRTIEVNQQVFITLRQQLEIAKIDELKERLLINILDIAEPAIEKARPKRTLIVLLSIISGIMLSSIKILITHSIESNKNK